MKKLKVLGVLAVVAGVMVVSFSIATVMHYVDVRRIDENIQVEYTGKEVHQYDVPDLKDFKVTLGNGREYNLSDVSEKQRVHKLSDTWETNSIEFYVDGKLCAGVADSYTESLGIRWSYDGNNSFPKGVSQGDGTFDESKLKVEALYPDDTVKDLEPSVVDVSWVDENTVIIRATTNAGVITWCPYVVGE